MELKKTHWVGIGAGLLIILLSLLLANTKVFFLVFGIGIIVAVSPFVFSVIQENKTDVEKEEMFLEFARDLVESVKSGTPINRSIINSRDKPYGALSMNIKKLANQISLGIPLKNALKIFSDDVNNKTISRALTLIGEAERAGGDIGRILESVASAVTMSDKLGKERKSAASTLVVQGYVIFFIFIVIILVMQFKILPLISSFSAGGLGGLGGLLGGSAGASAASSGASIQASQLSNAFLFLLLVQGLFSGLTIGKLSEGSVKAGIKHSFALMLFSFLISTGANLLFG
ncbi:MAG: type II secretion system F family protein [Nanoarchaeota archaeon]|nr:type II secretion system F family protein [Nanoarchaeota archaeon]